MISLNIKLDDNLKTSKVRQLVDAITAAISSHTLEEGEVLPSVNELSNALNIARDTVFKAYSELKKLGIVDSTRAKGYYVANSLNKIFLFLDSFSPYKDVLYNALIQKMDGHYTVDLGFHNYNEDIFETVISHSLGKYNNYVVMNCNSTQLHEVLGNIPKDKLLLLDWGNFEDLPYSSVIQNFGEQPYQCLLQVKGLLKKYDEFIYVANEGSQHPIETQEWFIKFCKEAKIKCRIETQIKEEDVQEGKAFFLVQHLDVVSLIKIAKKKNLDIGKHVGIICYNDSPMFEVIENGITVISTDFAKMGELAAEFILNKNPVQATVPTSLILRGSL